MTIKHHNDESINMITPSEIYKRWRANNKINRVFFDDIEVWPDTSTYSKSYAQSYNALKTYLDPLNKDTILMIDIGCSTGYATRGLKDFLQDNGYRVNSMGVDILSTVVKEAYDDGNVDQAIIGAVQKLPLGNECGDVIICHKLLDCIGPDQQARGLQEISRILKSDGIFLGILGYGKWHELRWGRGSTYIFRKTELEDLKAKCGFDLTNLHPEDMKPFEVWKYT